MVTGRYVEVYREAAESGERRRYTKRFLATSEGDFREWTEREWRTLARLVGHGARHVPDVVQYDRGATSGNALVQTYDAGVTVDHWATLLPVQRDGRVHRHVFQDCAHWWALAHHLLLAMYEIHALRLVHLDLKADNICIPLAPPDFNPAADQQTLSPDFQNIALIDFAFSVVSGETLTNPLPIGWQRSFRYQSPRLLQALIAGRDGNLEPTRQLDWRCDMYSLAALLEVLLGSPLEVRDSRRTRGWTDDLDREAKALLLRVRQIHDDAVSSQLPHLELVAACSAQLDRAQLVHSLQRGWTLATGIGDDDAARNTMKPTAPLTRVTLIEPRSVFTAVTEVLPQPDSHRTEDGAVSTLDPMATTEPAARPSLVLPGPRPAAGVSAMPRDWPTSAEGSHPSSQTDLPAGPAAQFKLQDNDLTHPLATPSLEAHASAREMTGIAHHPVPAKLPTAVPPVASARKNNGQKRSPAVHFLPVLAVAVAIAWWLAHDGGPPLVGSGFASRSSSGVEGTSATRNTRATAAIADEPRPSARPAQETAGNVPIVAAPPPWLPRAGRIEGPSVSVPPLTEAPGPVIAAPGPERAQEQSAQEARSTLDDAVPLVVANAEPHVARVLSMADRARNTSDDRLTVVAAASIGDGVFRDSGPGVAGKATVLARRLNEAARQAFYQERDSARAYELQRRAFDAHPFDVEVAGNLAFYALKMSPPRAEESRELAIYALALATQARRPSRMEGLGKSCSGQRLERTLR